VPTQVLDGHPELRTRMQYSDPDPTVYLKAGKAAEHNGNYQNSAALQHLIGTAQPEARRDQHAQPSESLPSQRLPSINQTELYEHDIRLGDLKIKLNDNSSYHTKSKVSVRDENTQQIDLLRYV